MNLKDYIQGNRSGKDANRLERQAQENLFLHDAIDGFDAIDGNHLSAIENLEKLVEKRLQEPKNKRFAITWRALAIAASFALLVGIGSLLFFQTNENETHVAETQENVLLNDEVLTAAVVQEIPVQDELLDIQPPVQPSEPPPPPPPLPIAVTEVLEFDLVAEQIVEEAVEIPETASVVAAAPPPPPPVAPPTRVVEESFVADAPTTVVRGRVLDELGEPLIGATIRLADSNIGTATDIDGNFSLSIPELQDDDLLIAFMGYETQRLRPERDMTIVMQEDTEMLSEVVVTAFATQRRESIVGAVSTVRADRVFGEEEFEAFLKENISPLLYADERFEVRLRFRIDANGVPTNIRIVRISCEDFREEVIDLIEDSPTWTRVNRNVRLNVRIRGE